MKASWKSRIAAAAAVCVIGSAGVAAPQDYLHRSSLRATVTMADGTARSVTLQGVGCPFGMCSRVRATSNEADSVWLDSLASVRDISKNSNGQVTAIFRSRDGKERRASIIAGNRVLYLRGSCGRTEKLDLASLTNVDFE